MRSASLGAVGTEEIASSRGDGLDFAATGVNGPSNEYAKGSLRRSFCGVYATGAPIWPSNLATTAAARRCDHVGGRAAHVEQWSTARNQQQPASAGGRSESAA